MGVGVVVRVNIDNMKSEERSGVTGFYDICTKKRQHLTKTISVGDSYYMNKVYLDEVDNTPT